MLLSEDADSFVDTICKTCTYFAYAGSLFCCYSNVQLRKLEFLQSLIPYLELMTSKLRSLVKTCILWSNDTSQMNAAKAARITLWYTDIAERRLHPMEEISIANGCILEISFIASLLIMQ